ncbi:hypothetical protein [Burkholderia vietnamiensis]|uniref:hypothetical protein n=1 Tax=Burkholderia vietnamiensis TaxID=60552 RepID=UPI0009BEA251|nr:hypothetical protein [Burkholderia vietnamiensis]
MGTQQTSKCGRNVAVMGAVAVLAGSLAACGGGGGGSSGGTSTTSSNQSNGQALLAAYTVPASIAADKIQNYGTPFAAGNTYLQANCAVAGETSTTVYVTPNTVVYATTGVSDKAQALAADLAEQGIAADKAFLGLSTGTVGYDGTRINVCVDSALGASIGETGTGVSGQGARDVFQVMSADSPNFDSRYPGATSLASYGTLYTHELMHVAHEALLGPVAQGALERWFAEGLATAAVGAPLPSKATILGYVDSQDLITAAGVSDMNVYPAYQATTQYILGGNGGLNFGATNIPGFLATVKADAVAACQAPIPSGIGEPSYLTDGMPAGTYNTCYHSGGAVDQRVIAAFHTAFNATFKNADGTPLLLHVADGAGSLEATLHDRLSTFLQQ